MDTDRIITGDSLHVLEDLPENSVHAIVTDPPYGLAFMGRDWDDFEPSEYQQWCENWAYRAKRVLRPGGHLLAFSGNRTHHRLFAGVEDAGYEVRDTVTWHYGSGFPKALDVSKAIDKAEGAEDDREVIGVKEGVGSETGGTYSNHGGFKEGDTDVTEPATDAAREWEGWKTTLKPATEFVVVARNPLGEDTVAGNVREWGTGALNIGDCRVGADELEYTVTDNRGGVVGGDNSRQSGPVEAEGRYPANVVFDQQQARELDRDVGDVDGCSPHTIRDRGDRDVLDDGGLGATADRVEGYADYGGPSRYFYTSKATRNERTLNGQIQNQHPTVKPIDLMEWLVKLTTRRNQTILDPFTGSGTTCRAAKNLDRRFVGIERSEKWADVARVRCGMSPRDPSHVRKDENQTGVGDF